MANSGSNYFGIINDISKISLTESIFDKNIPDYVYEEDNIIANNIGIPNILFDILQPINKCVFVFYSNIYLYYYVDGKYYIDINHIISKLVTDETLHKNTFQKYSNDICYSIWTISSENKFIRRELIDLNTMARIILSFHGDFSNTFRVECLFYIMIYQVFFNNLFKVLDKIK